MALQIKVTNTSSGVIGRAGYRFDPGESKLIEVAVARANEVLDAKNLDCEITGADAITEVPKGYSINVNASDAAQRKARELGVDVLEVRGTGKDGAIKVEDVEKAAGDAPLDRHEHWMNVHRLGGGTSEVSTLSPHDEQIAAQHRALEDLHRREARQRREAGVVDEPGAQPDQTGLVDEPASQPSPPVEATQPSPGNVEDEADQPNKTTQQRPSGG